jgi:MFS family permease
MSNRFDSRYLIVGSAFLTQIVMVGCMFAYGVFFKAIEADLGWSRTTLSATFSISFLVIGVLGMIAGQLSDRFGPRWILRIAAVLFGLGYALMYFVSSPWQMYLFYGVLVGAGISVHDVVILSTVARWFDKRRGMMTGIVKIGAACGQMTIPLLAVTLIAYFDWRTAFAILGCGATVLLLIGAQAMRRNPPAPSAVSALSDMSAAPESGLTLSTTIHTPQFWILCAVQFAFVSSLVTVPVHIPSHGMDLGMTPTAAAGLLSIIGLCSIAGRALVGSGADRIGGRQTIMLCLMALLSALLVLLFVETSSGLYLFAAIYGVSHGGLLTVVAPLVAEYFGTLVHGQIFGAILFFGTLGGALGPLLAGIAFDRTGSYQNVFIALTVLVGLGLALVSLLKPIAKRP